MNILRYFHILIITKAMITNDDARKSSSTAITRISCFCLFFRCLRVSFCKSVGNNSQSERDNTEMLCCCFYFIFFYIPFDVVWMVRNLGVRVFCRHRSCEREFVYFNQYASKRIGSYVCLNILYLVPNADYLFILSQFLCFTLAINTMFSF